jgi:hypothetical protein
MMKITLVKFLAGLTVQDQEEAGVEVDIEVAEEALATKFTGLGMLLL